MIWLPLRALFELVRNNASEREPPGDVPEVFDVTTEKRHGPGRDYPRAVEQVDTIVLHQTACTFGTRRSEREKYGERVALHRRFRKVPYHCVALLNGDVLWNNAIHWHTYHGGSANRTSIGVAVEGLYPGLESKRKPKHTPVDERVIVTARAAVALAIRKATEAGAPVRWIQPHRCYSGHRLADPGETLWREVAIPSGLETDCMLRAGSGLQVCREWDPRALYDYRGRAA